MSASLNPDPWLQTLAQRLDGWSRLRFVAVSTLLALGLSVAFFSPKFWLMDHPRPGTFEWDRALTFLQQCRDPFAPEVERAMRWRLLPPLVAHWLGLPGWTPFLISYAGLIALVAGWCAAAERLLRDRLAALLLTLALGTTGAVISVTTLYGLNDGWFLLGLLAVTAGRGRASLLVPGLLAGWVDERFFLGWPLAMFCRWWLQGRPVKFGAELALGLASLAPYVAIRGGYTLLADDRGSVDFVSSALSIVPYYLPYVRLGWWMGFRAAWPLLLLAVLQWGRIGGRFSLVTGLGCTLAGLLAVTVLAANLSRSTNLLLALLLCGACALRDVVPAAAARYRWLVALVAANLLMPYLTVIYTKTSVIWSLPLELLRLWKN